MNSDDNVAVILKKPLSGTKQVNFFRMILQHIFPVREEYGQLEGEE